MKNLDMKNIGGFLFYVIVGILLIWTASLDVKFIQRVLPENRWLPYFGLVLFDGGMLGWMMMYIHRARGTTQRMLSFAMTLVSLFGIGILSAGEIIQESGDLFSLDASWLPTAIVFVLTFWTFISVSATVVYHLTDPEIMETVSLQAVEDQIIQQALSMIEINSKSIGKKLAEEMTSQSLEKLATNFQDRIGNTQYEYEVTRHRKGYQRTKVERKRRKKKSRQRPAPVISEVDNLPEIEFTPPPSHPVTKRRDQRDIPPEETPRW